MIDAFAGYFPYAVAFWLFLVGLYGIVTSRHLVHAILCLLVVQSSTYILLLSIGYRHGAVAPFGTAPPGAEAVDPAMQALVLTDIVVGAAVAALLLALAVEVHKRRGSLNVEALRESAE